MGYEFFFEGSGDLLLLLYQINDYYFLTVVDDSYTKKEKKMNKNKTVDEDVYFRDAA